MRGAASGLHGGPGALPRPIRPDIESQSGPRYLPLSYVDLVGEVHIERLGAIRVELTPYVTTQREQCTEKPGTSATKYARKREKH